MIAGSKADSLYMTQDASPKATGTTDKEVFILDGATHIETYWVPRCRCRDGQTDRVLRPHLVINSLGVAHPCATCFDGLIPRPS